MHKLNLTLALPLELRLGPDTSVEMLLAGVFFDGYVFDVVSLRLKGEAFTFLLLDGDFWLNHNFFGGGHLVSRELEFLFAILHQDCIVRFVHVAKTARDDA
jgi:hypothetical protein